MAGRKRYDSLCEATTSLETWVDTVFSDPDNIVYSFLASGFDTLGYRTATVEARAANLEAHPHLLRAQKAAARVASVKAAAVRASYEGLMKEVRPFREEAAKTCSRIRACN